MTLQPSLPAWAVGALTHAYNNHNSDNARVDVYFLSSSTLSAASVTALCDSLTATYVHKTLGDEKVEDYHQFLTPILSAFDCVQECVDHHFKGLDTWLQKFTDTGKGIEQYPYGLLVFDRRDKDPLLIHADRINDTWHLGYLHLPLPEVGIELTSLIFGDIYFGDLCKNNDVRVPQNDPVIDPNYAEHEKDTSDGWKRNPPRFAAFSTGMPNARCVEDMFNTTPSDTPFGHSDVELYATVENSRIQGDWEGAKSSFPVLVAADQRGEKRHGGQGPCRNCRALHKTIFICIDKSDPMVDGVLVCRMDWDAVTEAKGDEDLKNMGLEANVETKRAGIAFAVNVAKAMATKETSDDTKQDGSGKLE